MVFSIHSVIVSCWVVFIIVWGIGALNTKTATRRQLSSGRTFQGAIILLGYCMVTTRWFHNGWLGTRFLPGLYGYQVVGLVLTVVGLAFAIWARVILGRNWSGKVTVKADHELIIRGPYALARHPIYTGILLATLGAVLAEGRWSGIVGLALVFFGFLLKMATEERMMSETFPDAYPQYRRRVKALIPGIF